MDQFSNVTLGQDVSKFLNIVLMIESNLTYFLEGHILVKTDEKILLTVLLTNKVMSSRVSIWLDTMFLRFHGQIQ